MCLVNEEQKKNVPTRTRREKYDRDGCYVVIGRQPRQAVMNGNTADGKKTSLKRRMTKKAAKKSKSLEKHGEDGASGGMESLIPSFVGLAILVFAFMAKMGFRGRASVAGIDLGTTNSVICVQAPSKGVGAIDCIPDPMTNSTIIPSVVSFLGPSERRLGGEKSSKNQKNNNKAFKMDPPPSHVVVGDAAKRRIESHPHQTLYNAKRIIGRPFQDKVIAGLQNEVEFDISKTADGEKNDDDDDGVVFRVPHGDDLPSSMPSMASISPAQVGSYVVWHLMDITAQFLGHENVQSAVICVPAKFDTRQRRATVRAFEDAGVKVTRIVEEPTSAALAYGLHKRDDVNYILVYDFGGGTLDISILHVTDGFVDVMGSDGDDLLGGSDFDAAVAHHLLLQYGEAVHRVRLGLEILNLHEDGLACPALAQTPLCTLSSFHTLGERLKIELSSYPEGGAEVETECLTTSEPTTAKTLEQFCDSLRPQPLRLSSQAFEGAVQHLYDRSVLPIRRLLKDLSLGRDEIDEVVMVGGTTRMPQIRRLVQEEMNLDRLNTHIDPDITVAVGAASVID